MAQWNPLQRCSANHNTKTRCQGHRDSHEARAPAALAVRPSLLGRASGARKGDGRTGIEHGEAGGSSDVDGSGRGLVTRRWIAKSGWRAWRWLRRF